MWYEPEFEREEQEEIHREDLRDGFAMNAMTALLMNPSRRAPVLWKDEEEFAAKCYAIADALMGAREKL